MRRKAGWVTGLTVVVVTAVVVARSRPAGRETAAAPTDKAVHAARAPAKLDLTKPFPKAAAPAPVRLAVAAPKAPVVTLDLTRPFPKAVPVAAAVRPVRYVGQKAPAVPLDLTTPFPKAPVAAVIPPAVP